MVAGGARRASRGDAGARGQLGERGEHAPPLEALAALGEVLRVPLDELVLGRRRGWRLSEGEMGRLGGLLAELGELLGSIPRE
jgi:hypothetical protein